MFSVNYCVRKGGGEGAPAGATSGRKVCAGATPQRKWGSEIDAARHCGCYSLLPPHIVLFSVNYCVRKGGGEGAPRVPNDPAAKKLDPEPREHVLSDQIQVWGNGFSADKVPPAQGGAQWCRGTVRAATRLHRVGPTGCRQLIGSLQPGGLPTKHCANSPTAIWYGLALGSRVPFRVSADFTQDASFLALTTPEFLCPDRGSKGALDQRGGSGRRVVVNSTGFCFPVRLHPRQCRNPSCHFSSPT